MKKILLGILFIFLLLSASGCVPLVVGAAVGGVGCYAISKDTVQAETGKSYDSLWEAALVVSKIRGSIKEEDRALGYIKLEADSSQVLIRIIRLSRSLNRIRISARRYHLPNLSLAEDIFTKIIEEAK